MFTCVLIQVNINRAVFLLHDPTFSWVKCTLLAWPCTVISVFPDTNIHTVHFYSWFQSRDSWSSTQCFVWKNSLPLSSLFLHTGTEKTTHRFSCLHCMEWQISKWFRWPVLLYTNLNLPGILSSSRWTNSYSSIFICWCQNSSFNVFKSSSVNVKQNKWNKPVPYPHGTKHEAWSMMKLSYCESGNILQKIIFFLNSWSQLIIIYYYNINYILQMSFLKNVSKDKEIKLSQKCKG